MYTRRIYSGYRCSHRMMSSTLDKYRVQVGQTITSSIKAVKGSLLQILAAQIDKDGANFLASKWGYELVKGEKALNQSEERATPSAEVKMDYSRHMNNLINKNRENSYRLLTPAQTVADIGERVVVNAADAVSISPDDEVTVNTSNEVKAEIEQKNEELVSVKIEELKSVEVEVEQKIEELKSVEIEVEQKIEELKSVEVEVEQKSGVVGRLVFQQGPLKQILELQLHELQHIPVWNKQRTLRLARVQQLADFKLAQLSGGGVWRQMGNLVLFHDASTRNIGLIDGQHRAASLLLLSQAGHLSSDHTVLCDLHEVQSEEEVMQLFREINSSEPVKLVDMPDEKDESDVKALNAAVDEWCRLYRSMFSPSPRCKPPHLHIDNLRDDVFSSGVLIKLKLNTPEKVLKYLKSCNDEMRLLMSKGEIKLKGKSGQQAMEKAAKHDMYLGLNKSWLE